MPSYHHGMLVDFFWWDGGVRRRDFKEVLTDVQGWYEGEAGAEFKGVTKPKAIKINAILMG